MPDFEYKARDARGASHEGLIEAADQREAMRRLREQGLTVTSVHVSSRLVDEDEVRTQHATRNVKRDEIVAFASQLAVMIETGVPLAEALGAYNAQARGGGLPRIVRIISDRVTSGVSFSAAIGEFPRVFPALMVSLVRASEASGSTAPMLKRVAEYLGKDVKTKRQIKGALAYPMIMLTMGVLVTGFLIAWVLPKFASIYEGRDAALPKPTQLLLGLSDAISANWTVIVGALLMAVVAAVFMKATRGGRRFIDAAKLQTPVVGPMFRNYYLTRITRTLATLLHAGVPLIDSIRIVRGLAGNTHWDDLLRRTEEAITAGRSVSEPVRDTPLVPPSIAQMISAGDRTGKLPEVLERVADMTEEQLEDAVRTGTQLIEPIMIITLGGLIGSVAVALLLPIFTMGQTMAG